MASIQPPMADVTVYFKVWDVDDPFDQLQPTMPEVNLIDDDDDGGDNRPPGSETAWSGYQSTNAYGVARKTFTVSMQPGNNYRAAATLLGDVFDPEWPQVDQTDADALSMRYIGSRTGVLCDQFWAVCQSDPNVRWALEERPKQGAPPSLLKDLLAPA